MACIFQGIFDSALGLGSASQLATQTPPSYWRKLNPYRQCFILRVILSSLANSRLTVILEVERRILSFALTEQQQLQ
jgi:hypothetical protein